MPGAAFWLVAGPNGAGKTTAAQRNPISKLLPDVETLNADDRTLELLQAAGFDHFEDAPPAFLHETFIEAANAVFCEARESLSADRAVVVETVLSTQKFVPLVELTHSRGGFFGLIYIALASPLVSADRIERRVKRGGHDVPTDRLAARWQRSVQNLGWFAHRADAFWVYDNTDSREERPLTLLAHGRAGMVDIFAPDAIPAITDSLTAAFSAG